jgi:hypothetical protein
MYCQFSLSLPFYPGAEAYAERSSQLSEEALRGETLSP